MSGLWAMSDESRGSSRRRWSRGALVAAGMSLALVLAACSGGDDDEPAADESAPSSTVADDESAVLTPSESSDGVEQTPTSLPEARPALPISGTELDPEIANRPAIAAKIDNVDSARPQAGINEADLVFEEKVEGGLTRLLAVFHSRDADSIGPIRSARSTDLPLLRLLGEPLFAWSGANAEFAAAVRSAEIIDVGVDAAFDAYVSREDEGRTPPSHLFTDSAALYAAAGDRGEPPRELFSYRSEAQAHPPSATPVEGVVVDYGATEVRFTWDAEVGGWRREQDGTPHVDDEGIQVAPANVVLQFVEYRDTDLVDAAGAPVPEAEFIGRGDAWYLVDGQLIEGSWERQALGFLPQFLSRNGAFARLDPGPTWVLLPEVGTVEVIGG